MASLSSDILSSAPFVVVDGVFNIRAIGGYKANDPTYVVKPGVAFRSGEISGITETGKEQLLALGIHRVFDLRTPSGDQQIQDSFPKEDPFNYSIRLKEYEENVLQTFVNEAKATLEIGATAFEAIFRHLLETPERAMFISLHGQVRPPVELVRSSLVSLTAGKDRTGLVAALILMLLGVDDTHITEDYALTTVGLEPVTPLLSARLAKIQVFRENPAGTLNMGSSRPESMAAILNMIRETYGGAAGYLTSCTSLSQADLDTICHNMLVKA
ncbi:protein-tyrosine phosphatase-like protein [Mycena rebaudengoi]|nr:protein-tyrosine phosphatase-like protein [Mycena rebaudengoi]